MPPSAEHAVASYHHPSSSVSSRVAMRPPAYPTKNVTFAVNYEVSMVHQFCATKPQRRASRGGAAGVAGEATPAGTNAPPAASTPPTTATRRVSNMENKAPNNHHQHLQEDQQVVEAPPNSSEPQQQPTELGDNNTSNNNNNKPVVAWQSRTVTIAPAPSVVPPQQESSLQRRVSAREKKAATPLKMARNRVRYDMQRVPAAKRHKPFLQCFEPVWWKRFFATTAARTSQEGRNDAATEQGSQLRSPPRRSSRLSAPVANAEQEDAECRLCHASAEDQQHLKQPEPLPSPFGPSDSTVVWVPSKRAEWEDTISEMTAVCTSAALRRHQARWMAGEALTKPFYAPLSRDYIRDRVDIDDPLEGFQLRHKTGGWLQGFCLWTNFTTWTHYFCWDSLHEKSGIPTLAPPSVAAAAMDVDDDAQFVDRDGSLAAELEAQPRSGDPHVGGIVFDGIAEISLLGGLGCGEYALRMALDDIRASDRHYKFVVLQATDSSKSFYERFGFRRVGAVCRYVASTPQGEQPPVQGYRHWTHSNESETSLQMHGGPSYMMCLKIRDAAVSPSAPAQGEVASIVGQEGASSKGPCPECGREAQSSKMPTFLEQMMTLKVDEKPKVESLGAAATPGPKAARRNSAAASVQSSPVVGELLFPKNGASATKPAGAASRQRRFSTPAATASSAASVRRKSTTSGAPMSLTVPPHSHKHRLQLNRSDSNMSQEPEPPTKRRRTEGSFHPTAATGRNVLLRGQEPLSMKQKEYRTSKPGTKSPAGARTPARRGSKVDAKKGSAKRRKSKTGASPDRLYHSVRGPDGRFIQVPITGNEPKVKSKPTKLSEKKPKKVSSKRPPGPPLPTAAAVAAGKVSKSAKSSTEEDEASNRFSAGPAANKPIPIDKANLVKQRVKSYPRNTEHYFNRVVKKKQVRSGTANKPQYFFVLHNDEAAGTIRIVPMEARGNLAGKREGRPRFQACIQNTDVNFLTVRAKDYDIVKAAMVMKTPVVASEAWDVEEA